MIKFLAISAKINKGLQIGARRVLWNDRGFIEDKPNGFAPQRVERFEGWNALTDRYIST